jgi:hypothetical protein
MYSARSGTSEYERSYQIQRRTNDTSKKVATFQRLVPVHFLVLWPSFSTEGVFLLPGGTASSKLLKAQYYCTTMTFDMTASSFCKRVKNINRGTTKRKTNEPNQDFLCWGVQAQSCCVIKFWVYILYDSVGDCLISPNDQKAENDFHHWLEHYELSINSMAVKYVGTKIIF